MNFLPELDAVRNVFILQQQRRQELMFQLSAGSPPADEAFSLPVQVSCGGRLSLLYFNNLSSKLRYTI